MENRKRSSAVSTAFCKKHPKHRQSAGVCSLCLRERLSKIQSSSSSSSRAVTNVSSSSSSSSISSVSSAYSSHCSSNASSGTASPMHSYRNRRQVYNLEGKGYLSFFKKNSNSNGSTAGVLRKSRSMAFVAEKIVQDDHEKKSKGGFWSKLIGSKRNGKIAQKRPMVEGNLRMMHSRTMREMFTARV